jgi:hypothetical protein
MSEAMPRHFPYVRRLVQPKAIILGVALLFVVVAHISVARWYREFGNGPIDVYPDHWLNVPYILLFATAMLLVSRWWSYLLALAIGGWLIYSLGYLGVLSTSNAQNQPLLSFWVLRVWFMQKYAWQPQELLQLTLAFVIAGFAVFGLARVLRRQRLVAADGI